MTIEQKIFTKLQPHAQRIKAGDGNDFDYLPAVLLQLMEEQKRHAQIAVESVDSIKKSITDTDSLVSASKNITEAIGLQAKQQVAMFERGALEGMEQLAKALNGASIQLEAHDSKSVERTESVRQSIEHSQAAIGETSVMLTTLTTRVQSLIVSTHQSHQKVMRLLIAGLVASAGILGVAITILQRH